MQSFYARDGTCLLEGVDLDTGVVRDLFKLLVDVVQDLAIHLQRLKKSFV